MSWSDIRRDPKFYSMCCIILWGLSYAYVSGGEHHVAGAIAATVLLVIFVLLTLVM